VGESVSIPDDHTREHVHLQRPAAGTRDLDRLLVAELRRPHLRKPPAALLLGRLRV